MARFEYAPDRFGGTEIMARKFDKYILPLLKNLPKYNLIVVPGLLPDVLTMVSNKNIFWLHNLPTQYSDNLASFLSVPAIEEKTLYYIVPSEYSRKAWIDFGFKAEKIMVISNAIELPNQNEEKKKNPKPKLIYSSDASRGLELLLRATELLDFDFELEIFSNFRLNEKDFMGDLKDVPWVGNLKNLDKITFYGSSPQKTVHQHVAQSDLLIYPSTYLETFCLAAVEAVGLGTQVITAPIGALTETLKKRATYVEYEDKLIQYIEGGLGYSLDSFQYKFPTTFSKVVKSLADTIRLYVESPLPASTLKEYSDEIREEYSWKRVTEKWLELDQAIDTL